MVTYLGLRFLVCRLARRPAYFLSINILQPSLKEITMNKSIYALVIAGLSALTIVTVSAMANDINIRVVEDSEVARIVMLRNVSIKDGEVSGEVVNNSNDILRNVLVEVRYSWRWANEFRPGKDDPGRTVLLPAAKELSPRASVRFSYTPSPPLPKRNDGYFVVEVKIAGFERIYY